MAYKLRHKNAGSFKLTYNDAGSKSNIQINITDAGSKIMIES
jgi:hypothetical protein